MVTNLEQLSGGPDSILDGYLDIPASMCARAGSRKLRRKYSPSRKPKIWAARKGLDICQLLQSRKISARGAAYLHSILKFRLREVHLAVQNIITDAANRDDPELADWYFKTFGVAVACGLCWGIAGLSSYTRDMINFGKLRTATWFISTFDIDFERMLPKVTQNAIARGAEDTLVWIEAQGWPLTIDPDTFVRCQSLQMIRHLVAVHVPRGWSYESVAGQAMLRHTIGNRPSIALFLLWKFGDSVRPEHLDPIRESSRACWGRDGARLRARLRARPRVRDMSAAERFFF